MSLKDDMASDLGAIFFSCDDGFGVPASYIIGAQVKETNVIISYGVNTEMEDGSILMNATVISLIKDDVGAFQRNHKITIHPKNPIKKQVYTVGDVIKDSGDIVDVFVRKA